MQSSAYGRQGNAGLKSISYASLSVVVVANGSAKVSRRATEVLKAASRDLSAQLILVSQDTDPALVTSIERGGAEFVVAPVGSTRAEMCDLGMKRAVGSIVAVRDDVAIGNAAFLDAYRGVLSRRAAPVVETVVMDTQVPERVVRGDAWVAGTLETSVDRDSIEIAAAI